MTKENSKPPNQEQMARERRLKEALRANLQRRRQKAHAPHSGEHDSENVADECESSNSDQN